MHFGSIFFFLENGFFRPTNQNSRFFLNSSLKDSFIKFSHNYESPSLSGCSDKINLSSCDTEFVKSSAGKLAIFNIFSDLGEDSKKV